MTRVTSPFSAREFPSLHYIVASSAPSPRPEVGPLSSTASLTSIPLERLRASLQPCSRHLRGPCRRQIRHLILAQLLPRCDKPGRVSRHDVCWETSKLSAHHFPFTLLRLKIGGGILACLPLPTLKSPIPGMYSFCSAALSIFSTCLAFRHCVRLCIGLPVVFLCRRASWQVYRCWGKSAHIAPGRENALRLDDICFQTWFVSISSFGLLIIFFYAYAFV